MNRGLLTFDFAEGVCPTATRCTCVHLRVYLALLPSGPDAVRRLKLHRVRAAMRHTLGAGREGPVKTQSIVPRPQESGMGSGVKGSEIQPFTPDPIPDSCHSRSSRCASDL